MKNVFHKLRDRIFAGLARKSDLDALYALISGMFQIQNAMDGKPVLRPMRGWAISPDAMNWILADLQELAAPTVVEFGSGQSTVIFAAALKQRHGRLFSVEHDPEYSAVIRRQVAACGLADQVKFLHAPLGDTGDEVPTRSYLLKALPDIAADIVLVDGPPFTNGRLTRLNPLRWAAKNIKPDGAIFLDDSAREFEKACLEQLVSEHPNLWLVARQAEKGLVEIRKSSP